MAKFRRPIAVMGVSGAGKTTVGQRLAQALGVVLAALESPGAQPR